MHHGGLADRGRKDRKLRLAPNVADWFAVAPTFTQYTTFARLGLGITCRAPAKGTWSSPTVISSLPFTSQPFCVSWNNRLDALLWGRCMQRVAGQQEHGDACRDCSACVCFCCPQGYHRGTPPKACNYGRKLANVFRCLLPWVSLHALICSILAAKPRARHCTCCPYNPAPAADGSPALKAAR